MLASRRQLLAICAAIGIIELANYAAPLLAAWAPATRANQAALGLSPRTDQSAGPSMNSIDGLAHGAALSPSLSFAYNSSLGLFGSKDEILDELDKSIEMHTNNHQSHQPAPAAATNSGAGSLHHSRHYNNQFGPHVAAHAQPVGHYYAGQQHKLPLKYSNLATLEAYKNELALGYMQSLLAAKPAGSAQSISGGAPASYSNYHAGLAAQTGLYSAPSLLLNSVGKQLPAEVAGSSQLGATVTAATRPPATPSTTLVLASSANNSGSQLLQQPNSSGLERDFWGSMAMCGKQQVAGAAREPRIVGGNISYEGEFPWAVSIQRHGNHHCGGVIVGRRWILTAAHCVRNQLVNSLLVRTGGHTLSRSGNSLSSHMERDYLVEQIIMHDDFSRYENLSASMAKSSANTNNADIALLKLRQDIVWNELAWPVCFPQRDSGNFSGHDAVVVGWGKLNEKSEDFSNELQKVKLTIIDNKQCQNWFRQAGREMPIDERIICAGFKHGGKDACHGDSGGPLLSKINGHFVVVGVVSTGIGCARPLLPGLYSRVSSYIGWIESYVS